MLSYSRLNSASNPDAILALLSTADLSHTDIVVWSPWARYSSVLR